MNGQMKNYDAYIASLKSMEVPVFKLDFHFVSASGKLVLMQKVKEFGSVI